jgi:hypothetical protein
MVSQRKARNHDSVPLPGSFGGSGFFTGGLGGFLVGGTGGGVGFFPPLITTGRFGGLG